MLRLKNVCKKYGEVTIFNNISIDIPKRAIISLLGKNGAGKTTLLKVMSGLIDFEGDILVDDISLKNNFNKFISQIRYIPNNPFLYEYLSVSEMIDLVISMSHKDEINEQKLYKEKLINILELEQCRNALIKELSLGTKQKVSYIINFINKPKLILIDEPFVNFDIKSMETILSFIKEYIVKNDAVIIFATHFQDYRINEIITDEIKIISSASVAINKKEVKQI